VSWSISKKYVRRDADFSRLEALGAAVEEIEKKYYANLPEKWLLELIVTDVKYRRRGAATTLIKWGTARADQEGICCRVEASPMGKPVYASCGFEELGPWDVQVKGQLEVFHMWCMFRKVQAQGIQGGKASLMPV
jgi:GNAT superfamily N-acetyltransferase